MRKRLLCKQQERPRVALTMLIALVVHVIGVAAVIAAVVVVLAGIAGAAATLASSAVTTPLDVVRTRLCNRHNSNRTL